MSNILVSRFSGVLSAYGLSAAEVVCEKQEACAAEYGDGGEGPPEVRGRAGEGGRGRGWGWVRLLLHALGNLFVVYAVSLSWLLAYGREDIEPAAGLKHLLHAGIYCSSTTAIYAIVRRAQSVCFMNTCAMANATSMTFCFYRYGSGSVLSRQPPEPTWRSKALSARMCPARRTSTCASKGPTQLL